MRTTLLVASTLACPLQAAAAGAAATTEHVHAELLAHAPHGIASGKPVWLGLAIEHQPHWHSYWRNPGDSGLPTSMSWQLNGGALAGDIAWPTPQAFPIGPLVNYGYEGQLLLPVPVEIPAGFGARDLQVRLQAEWLVCKDICVPEAAEFVLKVPASMPIATHGRRFGEALARVPAQPPAVRARATIQRRALAVEVDGLPAELHGHELRFFAELAGVVEHAAAVEQRWEATRWVAQVPLSPQRSESPQSMHAVLVAPGQAVGVRVRFPIAGSWSTASSGPPLPVQRPLASSHNARESTSITSTRKE